MRLSSLTGDRTHVYFSPGGLLTALDHQGSPFYANLKTKTGHTKALFSFFLNFINIINDTAVYRCKVIYCQNDYHSKFGWHPLNILLVATEYPTGMDVTLIYLTAPLL